MKIQVPDTTYRVIVLLLVEGFLAYIVDKYFGPDSIPCYLYILQLVAMIYWFKGQHDR